MIGLAIRFPAGRYHATPWGAHVNEAAVEWPPSPWRLLRALASAWHRTAPEVPATQVEALFDALAEPPRYRLPEAAPGHTRHYMPDHGHRRDVRLTQNLVFDAFLRLDPAWPVTVGWDIDLRAPELALLRRLAAGVTYLGRAESWCDMEVVDRPGGGAEIVPAGPDVPPDAEVVRLLAPSRPVELRRLEVTTSELQGGRVRWRDPPGARWLRYVRPLDWASPRRHPRRGDRPGIVAQAVLWALDARPLPLLTQVEEVVTAVRRAIPLRADERTGRLRVLAYPSDLGARPARLDRVAFWAERGLSDRELDVACRLGPFSSPGLSADVVVPLLLGAGRAEDLGGPLFGPARIWSSVTPLVPSRPAGPGEGPFDPARSVAESLAGRFGDSVRVLGPALGPVGWLEFRRGFALGARVELPEPASGPVLAERERPGFGLFLAEGAR